MCSFLCYRIPGLRHAFRKLISDLPKVLRIKFIVRRTTVFVRWVSRKAREFASGGPTVSQIHISHRFARASLSLR